LAESEAILIFNTYYAKRWLNVSRIRSDYFVFLQNAK